MICDGCRNQLVETPSGLFCPKCGIKVVNPVTLNLWSRLKQKKLLFMNPESENMFLLTPVNK